MRLGPAQLHSANQTLTIGTRTVALQRKPFLVLQYLIENRDRMILRKELLDQFWEGQEVYDESLSKAVGSIRKAFGDVPGSPQFIETRWGQGYRYIGPFDESPAPAANNSNHPNHPGGEGHGSPGSVPGQTTAAVSPTLGGGLIPQATSLQSARWRKVAVLLLVLVTLDAVWLTRRHTAGKNAAAQATTSITEDSIAQRVSTAPFSQSGTPALKPSSGPDTSYPQAYAKYMKARFFANARTQTSLAKAIDLLNQVILIDPKYARAYAALADCYQLQGFYHFVPPSEAYPLAKAAALKALSMDDSLAEAHISLLSVLTDYDWDWEGSEREFKAAIAIDPNYAAAYQYYGYALLAMGRGEEALTAMKHAAELDPVSPSIQTSLAWGYYLLRHNQASIEQCKRVLELYPNFVPAHQLLGILYGQAKSQARSFAELNLAEGLEKDSKITPILLDDELALSGKQAEAARNLETFLAKSPNASVPDYYLAAAWLAVGNNEKAQTYLERAFKFHSNWVIYLQYDPRFDDLRVDPRFQALLRRVAPSHSTSIDWGLRETLRMSNRSASVLHSSWHRAR